MPCPNYREPKWYDEDKEHSEDDVIIVEALARQWSEINYEIEQESFARQSRDDYDEEPYFDSEEEQQQFEHAQRVRSNERRLHIEWIEERLHSLGARMSRPYEHWNEEERYMEYMERDRNDY